jgi:hemophore-related protein
MLAVWVRAEELEPCFAPLVSTRYHLSPGKTRLTSAYLFTHPDVNDFMTSLTGQPVDQVPTEVQNYLDANPQTKPTFRASGSRWPTCGNAVALRF